MSNRHYTETAFPFRWKEKTVKNPSSQYAYHPLRHLSLICNSCDEVVIAGAPYNSVGQRYFTYYANQAAAEHLASVHQGNHNHD
jgi:hypothetical protein